MNTDANIDIIREMSKKKMGCSNKYHHDLYEKRILELLVVHRMEKSLTIKLNPSPLHSLHFNYNGTRLAGTTDEKDVTVWDWERKRKLTSFNVRNCKADDRAICSKLLDSPFIPVPYISVVTCGRKFKEIMYCIETSTGTRAARKLGEHYATSEELPPGVSPIATFSDPNVVMTVGEDGRVVLHDIRKMSEDNLLVVNNGRAGKADLSHVAVNPAEATKEFCVLGETNGILGFDMRNCKNSLFKLPPQSPMQLESFAYNKRGSRIVVGDPVSLRLYDTQTPYLKLWEYRCHSTEVLGPVQFFGPFHQYVVAGMNGGVGIWSLTSSSLLKKLLTEEDTSCIAVNSDELALGVKGINPEIQKWKAPDSGLGLD